MTARSDSLARKVQATAPQAAMQIRQAKVTDLRWVQITDTTQVWALFADFGSGGVQVGALQSVLDALQTMANAGTAHDWAVDRMVITATPPGGGMPIVIGFLGSISISVL